MKENFKWAMIPLAALILVVGWNWDPNRAASPDAAAAVDAQAVEIGQKYKTAFDAAGLVALDAAAHSTATTSEGVIRAQRDALQAALTQAATPVATELTNRFGGLGTRQGGGGSLGADNTTILASDPVDRVKAFYANMAAGWRKGAK